MRTAASAGAPMKPNTAKIDSIAKNRVRICGNLGPADEPTQGMTSAGAAIPFYAFHLAFVKP